MSKITNGSEIIAKVRIVDIYDVLLDIDFLTISTCRLGVVSLCEHMAAVFFALYALHGQRPELFMNECKEAMLEIQAINTKKANKVKRAQDLYLLDKGAEADKLQSLTSVRAVSQQVVNTQQSPLKFTLQNTESVEEWHRYFRNVYEQETSSSRQARDRISWFANCVLLLHLGVLYSVSFSNCMHYYLPSCGRKIGTISSLKRITFL